MSEFRFPTAAELYALEQDAQRARAQHVTRLLASGARRIKESFLALVAKPYAGRPTARGVRHA